MKKLVFQPAEAIREFVAAKCLGINSPRDFGDSIAFGWLKNDVLLAGVVLYNFKSSDETPIDVELAIASSSPAWCSKHTIKTIADIIFNELRCARVSARVARKNKTSRKLIEGIGFKLEGVKRKAFNGRQDLMLYGLLKEDCSKWLN